MNGLPLKVATVATVMAKSLQTATAEVVTTVASERLELRKWQNLCCYGLGFPSRNTSTVLSVTCTSSMHKLHHTFTVVCGGFSDPHNRVKKNEMKQRLKITATSKSKLECWTETEKNGRNGFIMQLDPNLSKLVENNEIRISFFVKIKFILGLY